MKRNLTDNFLNLSHFLGFFGKNLCKASSQIKNKRIEYKYNINKIKGKYDYWNFEGN